MREVTPALLLRVLDCDPNTGLLFWKSRSPDMFLSGKQTAQHNCANWNSRLSGKPAFTYVNNQGYLQGAVFNKGFLAHRVVWAITHGEWPNVIDHINGVRTDNKPANLRSVTRTENNRNARKRSKSTAGCVGVSWNYRRRKWVARIGDGGKTINLGGYERKEDAVAVRLSAQLRLGYHVNHGMTHEAAT